MGGSALDMRLGSSISPNSNDPLYLAPEQRGYVYLPGSTTDYLSVINTASTNITGDLDVRVRLGSTDILYAGTTPAIFGNRLTAYNSGSNGYTLYVYAGQIGLSWLSSQTDRAHFSAAIPTGVLAHSQVSTLWLRATLDVDNGSGGYTLAYYYSLDEDPGTWVQIGTDITGGAPTSVSVSTSETRVRPNIAAKVYRAQVYDGIDGTLVLDVDCDKVQSHGSISFPAGTGQRVFISRSTAGGSRRSVSMPAKGRRTKAEDPGLYLPGVFAAWAQVPDEPALDITSDIDMICRARLGGQSSHYVINKTDVSTQRSYEWSVNPGGASASMTLELSQTGSGATLASCTATEAMYPYEWFRVTWRASDGRTQFFVGTTNGSDIPTWRQLGTDVTLAVTSIFSSTSPVKIGARTSGNGTPLGVFYRAIIKNGIDGSTALDVHFSEAQGGPSFVCSTGQTVTIVNGLNNTAVRVRPERYARSMPLFLGGGDDYLECQDPAQHRLLNRDDSLTVVWVGRNFPGMANSGPMVTKLDTANSRGWAFRNAGTGFARWFTPIAANYSGPSWVWGDAQVAIAVYDRAARTVSVRHNDSAISTGGVVPLSLETTSPLRFFQYPSMSNPHDAEMHAAAIFTRALTPSEVALILDYYGDL